MRILLIQSALRKEDLPIFPLGLCYIASALSEDGHDVEIYDPNVSENNLWEELTRILKKKRYDVVGISVRNIDNNIMYNLCYYYEGLRPTLALIHKTLPHAKIMIGGPGYSIFAETIMKKNPLLDYGIYQEGTESVVELLNNLNTPEEVKGIYFRKGDNVYFSGPHERPDLNCLPAMPWDKVDIKKYLKYPTSVGIISKSGCVFNCSYCTYPTLSGKKLSFRSPELIVDDIEYLVNKHGLKDFFIVDSIFNFPLKHAYAVCEEIIRRNINVKWVAYFDVKYLNQEFVKLAVKAGCLGFSFSPDGIHGPTMKSLGKNISEQDLYRSYELIKKVDGATASYSFFLNPPRQDFTGFIKLLTFYFKTRVLNRNKFGACSVWYPRVYPNTPLHKYAIESGNFPENAEDLLPENCDGLYKLFWVNPSNKYLNVLYRLVISRKDIVRKFIENRRNKRGL